MIYIVEDDDAIRELEQYALQSNGYEVASFASSEPFWQAMRTEAPELVILDVMLPGEDGFSILKKLRNTPSLHRLPIIMVTAKSSELDTVRGAGLRCRRLHFQAVRHHGVPQPGACFSAPGGSGGTAQCAQLP